MEPDSVSDPLQEGPSTTRLVLSVLRSGAAITARDAAERAAEKAGRPVNPGTVSGILSRVSDPGRCDLGHFIHKGKSGGARVYLLAEEALSLTGRQLHGLTLRTGADRYPLVKALADHPRLRRLVPLADGGDFPKPEGAGDSGAETGADEAESWKSNAAGMPAVSAATEGGRPVQAGSVRLESASRPEVRVEEVREPKRMEVAFKFGGEEALNLNTSPALFWLLCLGLIIVFVSLALLAYTVLLPLLAIAAGAAGVTGAVWFLWRRRARLRKRAQEGRGGAPSR
jgi:hypothetical protein